jgi:arsenic resistance protein ArsH
MGDLNNTAAAREHLRPSIDPAYQFRSFAIPPSDDDPSVRQRYRPFLLADEISNSDWVAKLELATAAKLVDAELLSQGKDRLRILVLYGSLRERWVLSLHVPYVPPLQRYARES